MIQMPTFTIGMLPDRNRVKQVRFRDKALATKSRRAGKQVFKVIKNSEDLDLVSDAKKLDKLARKLIEEYLATDRKVPLKPDEVKRSKTIIQAIEEWLMVGEQATYKESTLKTVHGCFNRFFKNSEVTLCSEISVDVYKKIAADLISYLPKEEKQLKNQGIAKKGKTVSFRYFMMIRTYVKMLFGYMHDEGYLEHDWIMEDDAKDKNKILPTYRKGTFNKKNDIWTKEEYEAVRDSLTDTNRVEIILLRYTGLDRIDLAYMRHNDIKKTAKGFYIEKLREKRKNHTNPIIKLPLFGPAKEIFLERFNATLNDELLFPWIEQSRKNSNSHLDLRPV